MAQQSSEPVGLAAQHWLGTVWMPALRVCGYVLMTGALAMLLGGVLLLGPLWLRVVTGIAMFLAIAVLVYVGGRAQGQRDQAHGELMACRVAEGAEPSRQELATCYHPLKGLTAAAIGALPWFVAAVMLAVLAKPYTYQLQDLPTWLDYYRTRADIGDALAYYLVKPGWGVLDTVRVITRTALMPLANIATSLGNQAVYWLEKLSPLLVLTLPAAYAAGYLRGPALQRRIQAYHQQAKQKQLRRVARKQKKERDKFQRENGPGSLN